MGKSISVVHSIYGTFDVKRLEASIESIQQQKHPELDIIIAEQNVEPRFEEEAKKRGALYHFSPAETKEGEIVYNPGVIRNQALQIAQTDYIYTNDSDIIFLNPDYLSQLLDFSKQENKAVFEPPMLRLQKEEFEAFYEKIKKNGFEESMKALNKVNPYLLSLNEEGVELVEKERKGYIFTIEKKEYEAYKKDQSMRGWEPTIWHTTGHRGGTLAPREIIEDIGGYSSAYHKWGFEDSDLQWKLGEVIGITKIPREEEFFVLHLDHKKGYFSPEIMKRNQEAFLKRQEEGIDKAIEKDLRDYYEQRQT